ncbi:AraC family transcriptional regulator [Kriegella aquimaris]|uniref:Transcriptional regulator, AraC family n=1 Tax=Kriegella aquimaris TaxID=192904 RepID=A0A1G9LTF2_9FLAO|nr:AraC family transcriptional regulator [Kriegella aquimaris]SDL65266.1 transcriptional regulator, AraC family [Kriegella aquimaris]
MKIQLETISPESKSPFRVLHDPKLNDLFFWHFHPEYELVYIEGATATRHVGDHISTYQKSDLVLIGSNMPHLNFDHGVKTNYRMEVLHIKPSFRKSFANEIPELNQICELFDQAQFGIAFNGETKNSIGKRIKELHTLAPFQLFVEVMQLLEELSNSNEYTLLHDKPFVNRFSLKEQKRMRTIYAYIDEHYQGKITVDEIASLCNLSKPAFCRYFKKATGNSFVAFLNQYRISQAKRLLLMGKNITETCFDCGFESLSYFNRIFKKVTLENPSEFKKRHLNN